MNLIENMPLLALILAALNDLDPLDKSRSERADKASHKVIDDVPLFPVAAGGVLFSSAWQRERMSVPCHRGRSWKSGEPCICNVFVVVL